MILFCEISAVSSMTHMRRTNAMCGRNREFHMFENVVNTITKVLWKLICQLCTLYRQQHSKASETFNKGVRGRPCRAANDSSDSVCVYIYDMIYCRKFNCVRKHISLLLLMVLAVWKWAVASVVGGLIHNASLQLGDDNFQRHLI
jgi:hypothetical protein